MRIRKVEADVRQDEGVTAGHRVDLPRDELMANETVLFNAKVLIVRISMEWNGQGHRKQRNAG